MSLRQVSPAYRAAIQKLMDSRPQSNPHADHYLIKIRYMREAYCEAATPQERESIRQNLERKSAGLTERAEGLRSAATRLEQNGRHTDWLGNETEQVRSLKATATALEAEAAAVTTFVKAMEDSVYPTTDSRMNEVSDAAAEAYEAHEGESN